MYAASEFCESHSSDPHAPIVQDGSATALRVLLVDDSATATDHLLRELRRGGYAPLCTRVETAEGLESALDSASWDVVVADHTLPTWNGPDALALVKGRGIDVPVILVAGTIQPDVAVAAIRAGAKDFLAKDDFTRLVPAIEREVCQAHERHARRQAEVALRGSELRLRALVDEIPVAVVLCSPTGQVLTCNAAALAMLGLAEDELVGKRTFDPGWSVMGEDGTLVSPPALPDSMVVAAGLAVPHYGPDGGLEGITCTFTDSTAGNEVEADACTSEGRYRLLAENPTDMIAFHSPEGVHCHVSPACRVLLGYAAAGPSVDSDYEISHPGDTAPQGPTIVAVSRAKGMPGPSARDPQPMYFVHLYATMSDGTYADLVSFAPGEVGMTDEELVGLTATQARALAASRGWGGEPPARTGEPPARTTAACGEEGTIV